MIDDIFWFENEARSGNLSTRVVYLQRLVDEFQSDSYTINLKVLFTSPNTSHSARVLSRPEDQLTRFWE